MPDKKPNVFPSEDLIAQANQTGQEIANQFEKEREVKNGDVSLAEQVAAEAMAKKTAEQIAERERLLQEQKDRAAKLEEERKVYMNQKPPQMPPVVPPSSPSGYEEAKPEPQPVSKYSVLSQPQWDDQWDVLPLPSDGKLYPTKPKSLKVAFMTTADENIITNSNLINSGDFLEILFNRKILDENIRYRDLHVGDRNAIMLWLRATAFGGMYPIKLIDPATGAEFEYEMDLSTVKTIPLGAEPDKNGHFDFGLPQSGNQIKFKLLTVGEVEDIENHLLEVEQQLGSEYLDPVTYSLSKQIVSVNGNTDSGYIEDFVKKMRIPDSNALREYIDEIECGVDLSISVTTPSGETINTFIPLNFSFFWPKLRV
jgi:hypothetical protein